jgi:hypothetical protein
MQDVFDFQMQEWKMHFAVTLLIWKQRQLCSFFEQNGGQQSTVECQVPSILNRKRPRCCLRLKQNQIALLRSMWFKCLEAVASSSKNTFWLTFIGVVFKAWLRLLQMLM